mgnify:CR=1 FL=1
MLPEIKGYVGIQFEDYGRERETGLDCWGLVRLIYREVAGIELPTYGDISAYDLMRVAREFRKATTATSEIWHKVTDAPRRMLDVVVMTVFEDGAKVPYHCGLMVSPRRMVHIEKATHSHTVTLDNPTVGPRIIDIYRHVKLL